MTDSNPLVQNPPHPSPTAWRHGLWPYLLFGLAQGLAFWALSADLNRLSDTWRNALQGLALAGPLAWYLGDTTPAAWRKRLWVALGIGLLIGSLGSFQDADRVGAPGGWNPAQLLPAAVLGFVLVTLSAGVAHGRPGLSYPRLFEQAWRNAFALPLTGVLGGIWWMLMWAGAWLMKSIGLAGMETLLLQPWFNFTVGGVVSGLSMGAVLRRSDALPTLRRFWLGMNSCFLPLSLAFAAVWLAALCFTGVQPLFATQKAALFLFWFCTLAVVFANAAYQDGHDAPVLPAPLARLAPYCVMAWPVIPVLALLGDWALWLRVQQYGWTVDRIWAAVVGLVVTLHAAGYALSVWRRQRWMHTLPATNIGVALVQVVVLLALLSPVADSRRIAADSQVKRLLDGRVTAAEFDWAHLRAGTHGQQALQRLAALEPTDPGRSAIAQRAAREIRDQAARHAPAPRTPDARLDLLKGMEVLPTGTAVDPALLQTLARPAPEGPEGRCLDAAHECVLGLIDLNGDGIQEALLVGDRGASAEAVLYARRPDGWQRAGLVQGRSAPIAVWKSALRDGRLAVVPPDWPDLLVDGQRLRIR